MENTWRILDNVIQKKVTYKNSKIPFKKTTKLSKIKSKSQIGLISIWQLSVPSWQKKLINQRGMKIFMDMQNSHSESMLVPSALENGVLSIVNNFNAKNSRDCEDVYMKIVKHIIQGIVKPLTDICNKSFETSTFPNNMKKAKVILLYKNDERNRFSNYRTISLLTKILEKLFYVRANNFIEKCSLLSENQYGLQSNRSTSDAIYNL